MKKRLIAVFAASLALAGCGHFHGAKSEPACYWLSNVTNAFEPAPQGKLTRAQCFDLNSCGEGGGASGGGCYKWASGPNAEPLPWR